jgi:hypothetical protein
MTLNESLHLSAQIKDLLAKDLSHVFHTDIPVKAIEDRARELSNTSRERVFTPCNVILTMLLSAIQEDKSIQHGLALFTSVFEQNTPKIAWAQAEHLREQQACDALLKRKAGRPKTYQPHLPKSLCKPLSPNTAGYSAARKRLPAELARIVYDHSTDFGDLDKEAWHGMTTHMTDGTYLQLQDTPDIRRLYTVKGQEASYPQALLQVLIRQGTGHMSQFALGSRQDSELSLVIPMIQNLRKGSLLLADDLYNSYHHFCLILSRGCHIIVPGKRPRKHTRKRRINDHDWGVEVPKPSRPQGVGRTEWAALPESVTLRRITYEYPTKNGMEPAVLYTTLLDERITSAEIVAKYATRWDIEISIRETKTIMDLNVLRSKSVDMLSKELVISLAAYNLLRKVIAKSAGQAGFSPQEDLFQKYGPFGRALFLDKKGRVSFKQSPGRCGHVPVSDK